MLYLNTNDILGKSVNWSEIIAVLQRTIRFIDAGDYAQPMKPYLRYKDPKNRIIAMPSFVGGDINTAGIKWIASFPENIKHGIPRAHSLTILNNADNGIPICIINTAIISAIRTAAVSGMLIDAVCRTRNATGLQIGICGFGVIGHIHLQMLSQLLGSRIQQVSIYDLRKQDMQEVPAQLNGRVKIVNTWQEAYTGADIFITSTVSSERYINLPPLKGSLQLNVSLRDYEPNLRNYMDIVVVDNWDEVCRENTDIEAMYKSGLVIREETVSINDVICRNALDHSAGKTIMFNPMGMSAFDIAVGYYYYQHALKNKIGTSLND